MSRRLELADILSMMTSDTDPKSQALWVELHRKMTPSQRLTRALEVRALVRSLFIGNLRRMHPEISDTEIRRRMARAYYGEECAQQLFGKAAAQ